MGWLDINWQQPWLAPYREVGHRADALIKRGASVAEALNAVAEAGSAPLLNAGPLRFVAPAELPEGVAYETFIAQTASVPTRDNLHDFFNGLVWLVWPALKRRLHEIQATQIAAHGIKGQRGPVRDAITLFDENGAFLQGSPNLMQALALRDWPGLFTSGRAQWGDAHFIVVGHALLEQLAQQPRKPLCAHVWCRNGEWAASTEQRAAWHGDITAADLQPKPFHPLPVLGVPGWWQANESAGFYADTAVFRPTRAT